MVAAIDGALKVCWRALNEMPFDTLVERPAPTVFQRCDQAVGLLKSRPLFSNQGGW
jgi:hypothetical protein